MPTLSLPEVGDLLKVKYNTEDGWLLVEAVDPFNGVSAGRFLPCSTGLRDCSKVVNPVIQVISTIRCPHGKTTVYAALVEAVGRSGASGLMR